MNRTIYTSPKVLEEELDAALHELERRIQAYETMNRAILSLSSAVHRCASEIDLTGGGGLRKRKAAPIPKRTPKKKKKKTKC